MKSFKDFKIAVAPVAFTGDKIKIERVLNHEIVVLNYKIEPSNYGGERLTLWIEFKGDKRIIWTNSRVLREMIEPVNKEDFPFTTTIVKENEQYQFR